MEQAEQERIQAERQELERQIRTELSTKYGDLLPDTVQLLYSLRRQGHYQLVDLIGNALVKEKEHARRTEAEERNQLTEEIMQLGEKMGYSAMTLGDQSGPGDFAIMGGVDCWSTFVSYASIDMLRQARNTAYYHTEGYERSRQRLKALSDQS
jgi:hypothetical protein